MRDEYIQISIAVFPYLEERERKARVAKLMYQLKKAENNGNIDDEADPDWKEKLGAVFKRKQK